MLDVSCSHSDERLVAGLCSSSADSSSSRRLVSSHFQYHNIKIKDETIILYCFDKFKKFSSHISGSCSPHLSSVPMWIEVCGYVFMK